MKIFNKIKDISDIKFLLVLAGIAIIFSIPFMIITGNTNQVYNDIILEWTSAVSSNKSAEMFLIYFLSFMGIGLYGIFYFFIKDKSHIILDNIKDNINIPKTILTVVTIITLLQTIILFDYKNYIFYALFLYTLLLYLNDKDNMLNGIVFFFVNTYTVYAVYRLFVFLGLHSHLDYFVATLISFIMSCVLFFIKKKNLILTRIILVEQIVLPCLLLIYLQDKYKHINQVTTISVLPQVQFFIFLIITCCLFEAVYLIKKYKKNSLNQTLSFGSCISIIGFNLFNNVGALVPTDLHHPFENIIGFHQIFQMGEIPFKEYIPVSGMYSVVHGALFQLFGNGELSQYYNSANILFLLVAIVLITLLSKHLNRIYLFIFSVSYFMLSQAVYANRFIFVLPIFLLLTLPKIINNPNLWLKFWILSSLFHGLYYPVFGAAVSFAFLPLAIYEIYTYIKSKDFKNDIKGIKFWINWILCFIPIISSIPLLWGTYIHIKAMGSQTILADGISRFGQAFGRSFMPYLSDRVFYKQILIYLFTFIIPAFFVWLAFAFALRVLNFNSNKKYNIENIKDFCIILSLVIFPLVSYTYTTVRLDVGTIYARSTSVFITCIVLFVIFAFKYLKAINLRCYIISFSIFALSLSGLWGFRDSKMKLYPYYSTPNNYLYIINDNKFKIGTGWIENSTYNYIKSFNKNEDYKYTFAQGPFGISYIYNLLGISVIEGSTVKGFSAAEETVNLLKTYNVNIGAAVGTFGNYYLYHYLIMSDKYGWDKENRIFVPNKQFITNNKYADLAIDGYLLGKNAGSLGSSIKTLSPIFTKLQLKTKNKKTKNGYEIKFDKPIYGNDCDFIYIKFVKLNYPSKYAVYSMEGLYNVDKNYKIAKYFLKKNYSYNVQVKVEWFDDNNQKHFMLADMDEGELLIPLGAGKRWLLDNHSVININVLQNGKEIVVPEIKNIEFLKLREVK